MATKFFLYTSDAADLIGLEIEEALMALYNDVVGTECGSGYADWAAFMTAHASGIAKPTGLQVRQAKVTVEGFIGQASLPILSSGNQALLAAKMAGATPFPVAAVAESNLNLDIVGSVGEARLSN